jgi:hypothetical protein
MTSLGYAFAFGFFVAVALISVLISQLFESRIASCDLLKLDGTEIALRPCGRRGGTWRT